MGSCYLRLAHDLGYTVSFFNLVFASNLESIRLWDGLGFHRVSALPGAAHLQGIDSAVTAYGYYFDLTSISETYDPVAHAAASPKSRLFLQLRSAMIDDIARTHTHGIIELRSTMVDWPILILLFGVREQGTGAMEERGGSGGGERERRRQTC